MALFDEKDAHHEVPAIAARRFHSEMKSLDREDKIGRVGSTGVLGVRSKSLL
jgi:hypothetical protein